MRLTGRFGGRTQSRADLFSVGVLQVVEDRECFPPGCAGSIGVADGLLGVAEVAECLGLLVAVSEFQADIKGPLVAGDGIGVPAEVMVGVAGSRLEDTGYKTFDRMAGELKA